MRGTAIMPKYGIGICHCVEALVKKRDISHGLVTAGWAGLGRRTVCFTGRRFRRLRRGDGRVGRGCFGGRSGRRRRRGGWRLRRGVLAVGHDRESGRSERENAGRNGQAG